MSGRRIAIFGAGGCGRDILAAVRRAMPAGSDIVFVDDARAGHQVCGTQVIARHALDKDRALILAVADGRLRERLAAEFPNVASFRAATALVHDLDALGAGHVLSDYVLIGPNVRIGMQFQANYYSYVAHDCRIGNFVTFGPRVSCNGNVTIGDHAYIGAGAVLRQGVVIHAGAVIGMGAVVVKDVLEGTTVVGNPARSIVRR